ncbi:MAG: hypothetical protein P8X42_14975, partial [Calditrichaceae bacterium]
MKYLLIQSFLLLFFIQTGFCSGIILPDNNAIDGWQKSDPQLTFYKNDLYGHIDGGAELFLEFGFDSLLVQDYSSGEAQISLEVYFMEKPESALGIYLMKTGKETPSPDIGARNSASLYQVLAVKDKYFIQLNNFKGDLEAEKIMPVFFDKLLSNIPDTSRLPLLKLLPVDGRINGSEKIIRGQYSLQSVYTFGDGDILQLGGKIFGVVANYKNDQQKSFTQIIVPYPSKEKAQAVYDHLITILDPYLTVIK